MIRVYVNRSNVEQNRRDGGRRAEAIIQPGNVHATNVSFDGPSRLVYRPERANEGDGAVVWIETAHPIHYESERKPHA